MSCHYLHPEVPAPGRWHRLWCAECRKARSADATLVLGVECMKAEAFPEAGLSNTLAALGLPSSPAHHRRRIRLLRQRILLPAGTLTCLLALAGYGWLRYIDADPNIPVYMPVMPYPNAYDSFVAAGQALQEEDLVGSALRPSASQPAQRTATGSRPEEQPLSRKEKEQILLKNQKALQLVRSGLKHPYQEPPARSIKALFPHFAKYRSLARLLALEGQVKAERGDWKGAAHSGLDAMELGIKIPHGSILIGKLVGMACEAIGQSVVWEAADHLSVAEAQEIAGRLEKITAQQVSFAETLEEEKWCGLASLQKDILAPGWRWGFYANMMQPMPEGEGIHPNEASVQNVLWYLSLLRYSKRQIVENYVTYMDETIAKARAGVAAHNVTPLPNDPVNQLMLPVFSQASMKFVVDGLQSTMLHTKLALRAYRLEQKQYPESLKQLVPRYMKALPADPFRPGSPLSYQRQGETYLLYSIGPDGQDGGGVPVPSSSRQRAFERNVEWKSQGDIVAGKNLP